MGAETAIPNPTGAGAKTKNERPNDLGYTAADIQVLEGVQAIRRRPGMYIGSTSTSGLLHLLWEAIDNACDEYAAGFGKRVSVKIDQTERLTVRDDARGMPFDPLVFNGKSLPAATVIFTVPHSGGKFEEGVYKAAGGLHGVGATVISALASDLEVVIRRDGKKFTQKFSKGVPGPHRITKSMDAKSGTQLSWRFDPEIFDSDVSYPRELIASRLQAAAYLNRGLAIEFQSWDSDRDEMVEEIFQSKEGLSDYVRALLPAETNPVFAKPITMRKQRGRVQVEASLQPNSGYKTSILSFANGVRTRDGGVHETGFKAALTRVINDFSLKSGVIKNRAKESFKAEVIQQGLVAVVSVKLEDPQFQGQTKDRLNNAPVEGIVRSAIDEGLKEWIDASPDKAREWARRIQVMQKARNEAVLAEELSRRGLRRNGELVDTTVSKKFLKCNTNDPARAELFIVEGDSAGGSASQGRFSDFQAVLKLKGKPLNVARADLKRIVANEEIRTIINVLGCSTRQAFDITKLRFHRIVLLTDADVDGLHIQCLLLTLLFREFPQLVERGHVFIGCPPLYSVRYRQRTYWLLDDEARHKFLRAHRKAEGLEFRRYKGLGEMTAKQLRETTLDPERRMLKRVMMDDAAVADKLVHALMEESNAEGRRSFLAQNSRKLADIDF